MRFSIFRRELQVLSLVLILVLTTTTFGKTLPVLDKVLQTAQQSHLLPPIQYIPDRNFDTRHVALDIRFNWEQEELSGVETLSFKPLVADLRKIELDAAEMTISSVKTGGTELKFVMDLANQKLRIELGRPYQPTDEVSLVIDYHTNGPQSKLAGLVGAALRFIKPTPDDPSRPKQIWSQGESEYNHYWFPCYDHPNDFFTSEITATVEKPLSVISNGKLLDTKENKDGTRTFHWNIEDRKSVV